jgi:hypothetical protein
VRKTTVTVTKDHEQRIGAGALRKALGLPPDCTLAIDGNGHRDRIELDEEAADESVLVARWTETETREE